MCAGQFVEINNAIISEEKMGCLVKISFKFLWKIVALLPFAAFLFCIFWSLVKNFEETTNTHCHVQNFLPSISTAVGSFNPQKYIWQLSITLHCGPRILISFMYYNHFRKLISGSRWTQIPFFICFFQNIEIFCLVSLSLISSSENFPAHQKFFVMFVSSALISMFLIYVLLNYELSQSLARLERKSVRLKLLLLTTYFLAFSLSVYFYFRHNWYCEPGMYTLFALSEYTVVLSNIGFHYTTIYDFPNHNIVVATG